MIAKRKLFDAVRVSALSCLLALILTSCGGSSGSSSGGTPSEVSITDRLKAGQFPTSFSVEVLNQGATSSLAELQAGDQAEDELYRLPMEFFIRCICYKKRQALFYPPL